MAMKSFLILLLSSLFFTASAQTKSTASVQQGITFRLLPVAVVERVSAAASSGTGTASNDSFGSAEARQKWAVQLKKITALDEQSYASFSAVAGNNRLQERLSSLQLYTVSKP